MQTELEQQLDTLWEQSRVKKMRKVDEMNAEITRKTSLDLAIMKNHVRDVIASCQPELRQKLDELNAMAQDFGRGVEVWQQRAQLAMQDIATEQQKLKLLVQSASERLARRKSELNDAQARRFAALERDIAAVLARVEQRAAA